MLLPVQGNFANALNPVSKITLNLGTFAVTTFVLNLLSNLPLAQATVSYTKCVDSCVDEIEKLSRSECEDWCRETCARPNVDWSKYNIGCYDMCMDKCYGPVNTCKKYCIGNCRI